MKTLERKITKIQLLPLRKHWMILFLIYQITPVVLKKVA